MHNRWRWGILLYLPLVITLSNAKELRPSDHGLTNKADPPQATSPQMSSFFGTASNTQPLPEAKNYTDPSWTAQSVGGKDNVRKVLIVSSLVCGVAGVVLLVVAGFLFVRRTRN